MLDVLYRLWPTSRVPIANQSQDAFGALGFDCRECLAVMFRHGLPPGVLDSRKYNLFMSALDREDLDMAEWLLTKVKVPFETETMRGVTPTNSVQFYLARYRPDTPTHQQLLRMGRYMEAHGVVFPVETSDEIRARKGVK